MFPELQETPPHTHSHTLFQSRSGPRMERTPQPRLPLRWIFVLVSLCIHADAHDRRPGGVHTSSGKSPASDPPPAVRVRCHSDSMEVAVRADVFDWGLLVEARHLRLGPGPAAEGGVCGAAPPQPGEEELILRAPLMDCGMKRSVRVAAPGNDVWLRNVKCLLSPQRRR